MLVVVVVYFHLFIGLRMELIILILNLNILLGGTCLPLTANRKKKSDDLSKCESLRMKLVVSFISRIISHRTIFDIKMVNLL